MDRPKSGFADKDNCVVPADKTVNSIVLYVKRIITRVWKKWISKQVIPQKQKEKTCYTEEKVKKMPKMWIPLKKEINDNELTLCHSDGET